MDPQAYYSSYLKYNIEAAFRSNSCYERALEPPATTGFHPYQLTKSNTGPSQQGLQRHISNDQQPFVPPNTLAWLASKNWTGNNNKGVAGGRQFRPFACEKCPFTTTSHHALSTHTNAVHSKAISFPCPTCDKIFFYKSVLMKHQQTHLRKGNNNNNAANNSSRGNVNSSSSAVLAGGAMQEQRFRGYMAQESGLHHRHELVNKVAIDSSDNNFMLTMKIKQVKGFPGNSSNKAQGGGRDGAGRRSIRSPLGEEDQFTCPICMYRAEELAELKEHVQYRHLEDTSCVVVGIKTFS